MRVQKEIFDVEFAIFTTLPQISNLERKLSLAMDSEEQKPLVKFRLDRLDCVFTQSRVFHTLLSALCSVCRGRGMYAKCSLYRQSHRAVPFWSWSAAPAVAAVLPAAPAAPDQFPAAPVPIAELPAFPVTSAALPSAPTAAVELPVAAELPPVLMVGAVTDPFKACVCRTLVTR